MLSSTGGLLPALPEAAANPVLVEVWRGDAVESVHRGAISVMSSSGDSMVALGDVGRTIFPRSAVKMIQALPLIESGAAESLRLSDRHIALACASHTGEVWHVHMVREWLAAMELAPAALECGAHVPFDRAAADELVRRGEQPSVLHNNCSGKHAGFLACAVHAGEDPHGYIDRSHPVQRRVSDALGELTGAPLTHAPCGVDGCGIPAFAIPLRAIAHAMARFADGRSLGPVRTAAARRVVEAMMAHPWLVSGTGRFDQRAMTAGAGRFATKMGAEGVHTAIVPGLGLGIAVKIDDGASRAAEIAMAAILNRLGVLGAPEADALGRVVIRNSAGRDVGMIVAEAELARPVQGETAEAQS